MTEPVHDALARRGLRPGEHAADSGYASADLLLAARARGITLLAPVPPDPSQQARSGGYTAAMFAIDWENKQVTCPQGAVSSSWSPARSKGTSIILARFAKATCQPCPARAQCTTAVRPGRQLGFRHRRIHEALTAARAEQAGDAWQHRYRIRAGVEGSIAQATHVTGIRRARYLGLGKTRLEHNTAAAAINLIRPRRLAGRQATGPDPEHPPAAAGPRRMKPEKMTTNKPTGSRMAPTACSISSISPSE